jgi:hypothetical protein
MKRITLEQHVHVKAKRTVPKDAAEFARKAIPIPPQVRQIKIIYVSLLSLIQHICASPAVTDQYLFNITHNTSFQEYSDTPLYKEYLKYRHQLSVRHKGLLYHVGEFVQVKTDAKRVFRIDEIKFNPQTADALCRGKKTPELILICSPFLFARFWRSEFSWPRPPVQDESELIQIEDGYSYDFSPRLIVRKYNVIPAWQRPENLLRRPNLTAYCNFVVDPDSRIYASYTPLEVAWTPPELTRGM